MQVDRWPCCLSTVYKPGSSSDLQESVLTKRFPEQVREIHRHVDSRLSLRVYLRVKSRSS